MTKFNGEDEFEAKDAKPRTETRAERDTKAHKREKRVFDPVPGSVSPEVEKLWAERREAEANFDDDKVAEIDAKLAELDDRE